MASVTGKTSIKIDDLINDTIVNGEIVGGHLILRNRGGAEIDAGVVTGSDPLAMMPIGFVYMSVLPTSPETFFGGTWVRIGEGRVLIGQDPNQVEFNTAEKTGGEKEHVLTEIEMPGHNHAIDHDHPSATTGTDGNHTHVLIRKGGTGTSTGVARGNATASADGTTEATGGHSHTVDVPAYTGDSGSSGAGQAHNNLQPYLVVYMWKRVPDGAVIKHQGSASFYSEASLTVIGTVVSVKKNGIASFSAQSSFTVNAKRRARATASLSAQSSLTANGTVVQMTQSVKLSWMSDIQGNLTWTTDMANMLSRLNAINPDYLIAGGDMAADGLTTQYNAYDSHMSAWYNKTLPVNGNHDGLSGNLNNFFAYFGPRIQAIRPAASATEPWWSIDIAGWHLIGLSIASGGTPQVPAFSSGSAQYNWLQSDLAANASGNNYPVAAFWHMPRYADHGNHGDVATMANIATLLYNAGCKFTVHGHIHNNERFPKADFNGNLQSNGSIEFTSTGVNWDEGAQNSVLTPDWRDPDGTVQANIAMLTFTLTPTSCAWNFIRVSDGQSLDSGTINV